MSSETREPTISRSLRQAGATVRAMRPRQWTKNLIVISAPVAAGTVFEPDVLKSLVFAFVSFSLLASSLYVVNDLLDVDADRLHPVKSQRPIASGDLGQTVAIAAALGLAAVSFVIAYTNLPRAFVAVLALYALNTLIYSMWGKGEPNVDMLQVAAGFVLRAVAGAVAVDVPMSQWFLGIAMFGSLFMVAGKRASEKATNRATVQRPVLDQYGENYLGQVMTISACAMLITYALWAFGDTQSPIGEPWDIASLAPFTYSTLHYLKLASTGQAEQPEHLVLKDRRLQAGAASWLGVIAAGVYL